MSINHEKVNEIVRLSQGVSPSTQRLFALIIAYKDKEKTQEFKRFGSFKAVCQEFGINGVGTSIEAASASGKPSRTYWWSCYEATEEETQEIKKRL